MRFAGKVAVVTGAASGIGRATCRRLAAEGSRVALLDIADDAGRTAADELARTGAEAFFAHVDVGQPSAVEDAMLQVIDRWGRLDVLVNCAAVMTFEPVVDLEAREWDYVLGTNLRSVFLCCKYSVPHMSHGAIVNVSSVHAQRTTAAVAPYAASKAGIEAFTRALAIECKARGIRVNAVAPGAVDTPMLWANPLVRSGAETPGGDIGKPEDVAAAIAFLASDDAEYLTGVVLVVDGGRLSRL